MSKDAVIEFINASENNPTLNAQLANTKGSEAVLELAARHGFEFTLEELDPVVHVLRFLHDVIHHDALRTAVELAADDDGVARIARAHGYEFSAADLAHVSFAPTDDPLLSDAELDAVVGGAGMDTRSAGGLSVQLQTSRQKTSTGTSFSEIAASGMSKSADVAMSAGQIAAPYIPGGSVLSAAMSD